MVLAAVALIATGAGTPAMAAPGNDDFSDAITITGSPYSNAQSTVDATTQADEPSPCGFIGSTVWYEYTPAADEQVEIDTFGSGFDTVLAVYTGDTVDDLTEVDCNDDTNGFQSQIVFLASAGETYRIQAGGYNGASGDLELSLATSVPATPPENDDFDDAIGIGGLPYTNDQSTEAATEQPDEPSPCGLIGSTVWYEYTPGADEQVEIDTFGSGFDTALAVYTGDAVDDLTGVGCNDDTDGLQSQIVFLASAGETYRIQVGGYDGGSGDLELSLATFVPPTPPENDDFDDAFVIDGLPYTNNQTTAASTEEPGEPSPCGGIGSTVWYAYTPSLPGAVTVDTFGSGYDTVLAAYVEVGGGLVNIACNDDTGGLQSEIQIVAVPGVTVYIQVGGFAGDQGPLVLNASGLP